MWTPSTSRGQKSGLRGASRDSWSAWVRSAPSLTLPPFPSICKNLSLTSPDAMTDFVRRYYYGINTANSPLVAQAQTHWFTEGFITQVGSLSIVQSELTHRLYIDPYRLLPPHRENSFHPIFALTSRPYHDLDLHGYRRRNPLRPQTQ